MRRLVQAVVVVAVGLAVPTTTEAASSISLWDDCWTAVETSSWSDPNDPPDTPTAASSPSAAAHQHYGAPPCSSRSRDWLEQRVQEVACDFIMEGERDTPAAAGEDCLLELLLDDDEHPSLELLFCQVLWQVVAQHACHDDDPTSSVSLLLLRNSNNIHHQHPRRMLLLPRASRVAASVLAGAAAGLLVLVLVWWCCLQRTKRRRLQGAATVAKGHCHDDNENGGDLELASTYSDHSLSSSSSDGTTNTVTRGNGSSARRPNHQKQPKKTKLPPYQSFDDDDDDYQSCDSHNEDDEPEPNNNVPMLFGGLDHGPLFSPSKRDNNSNQSSSNDDSDPFVEAASLEIIEINENLPSSASICQFVAEQSQDVVRSIGVGRVFDDNKGGQKTPPIIEWHEFHPSSV